MNAMAPPPKPFTWSYSQLKNFETCERRNQQIDRLKAFKEDSDQLRWGNAVHDAMAKAIGKGHPLPNTMKGYQPYVDLINRRKDRFNVDVERKLAFTRDFQPCDYFHSKVWFRGVVDVSLLSKQLGAMFDWKTGKVVDDNVQLGLFATMLFCHYPELQRLETAFVWLPADATTKETWTQADMPRLWADLMPRVERMEAAYKTNKYEPNPSGLCKRYCPVDTCEYHGIGSR